MCALVQVTDRIWRWYRAGGDVVCEICGRKYYDHPREFDPAYSVRHTEFWVDTFLKILCNGDRVKL